MQRIDCAGSVLAAVLSTMAACSGDDKAPPSPSSTSPFDSGAASDAVAGDSASNPADARPSSSDATPGHCPNTTVVCNGRCLVEGESSGNCTVLMAGLSGLAMALTPTALYFTAYDFDASMSLNTFVYRLPLSGGAPQKMIPQGLSAVADIVADSTHLYFLTLLGLSLGDPDFNQGRIGRIPFAGGDMEIITRKAGEEPATLAVAGGYVYWVGESPGAKYDPPRFGPAVHRVALSGGDPVDIGVATKPQTIGVDATHVYWADGKALWRTATATAGSVPIVDGGLDAGGATKVADTQTESIQIALDGDVVYYVNGDSGGLYRVAKAGGTPALVASSEFALNLVVDANDVFFTGEFGDVKRYHKADGTSQSIAKVASWGTRAIAADNAYVYELVNSISQGQGAGGIVRIAR